MKITKIEPIYVILMMIPGIGPIIAYTLLDIRGRKYPFYRRQTIILNFILGVALFIPFYICWTSFDFSSQGVLFSIGYYLILTILLDFSFVNAYNVSKYGNFRKDSARISDDETSILAKKKTIFKILLMIPFFGSFLSAIILYIKRNDYPKFSLAKYIFFVLIITLLLVAIFIVSITFLPSIFAVSGSESVIIACSAFWLFGDLIALLYLKAI